MYKGDKLAKSENYISDFIESQPPDKTLQEWAQSMVIYVISMVTNSNMRELNDLNDWLNDKR